MIRLIVKRLAAAAVIVAALTAGMFVLQKVSPVDPVHAMLGAQASAGQILAERRKLGLDRPLVNQYVSYLAGLPRGDFGMSYRTRRPVGTDLASFVPATAELSVCALLFALILAALLAIGSTLRWPGAGLLRLALIAGASVPAFLLAIAGILIFYQRLGWLPATGRTDYADAPAGPTGFLTIDGLIAGRPAVTLDALRHLLMPALAVAAVPAVSIGRVLRSSLISGMLSDYVRTARAKGLSERRIVLRHVLRNCAGAALSMTGLQVGLMFSGVLVVEQVFAWPGIGQYMAQSIPAADFPAIAGVTLLLGVVYVAVNTIVDILQAVADPRISA
jgi:peptide/nickel transport system permease protein